MERVAFLVGGVLIGLKLGIFYGVEKGQNLIAKHDDFLLKATIEKKYNHEKLAFPPETTPEIQLKRIHFQNELDKIISQTRMISPPWRAETHTIYSPSGEETQIYFDLPSNHPKYSFEQD